eukprot:3741663-Amphidinium_carterae.1
MSSEDAQSCATLSHSVTREYWHFVSLRGRSSGKMHAWSNQVSRFGFQDLSWDRLVSECCRYHTAVPMLSNWLCTPTQQDATFSTC